MQNARLRIGRICEGYWARHLMLTPRYAQCNQQSESTAPIESIYETLRGIEFLNFSRQ